MPDTKKPEKYGLMQPISDRIAEDPDVMTVMREATVERWREVIAAEGWVITAEPVLRSDINIGYGWPLHDGDEPIFEIGSFDGGTLWAWQQICPTVVGVDLPPPGHEATVRLNTLGCPIVLGDSHDPETVERLKAELNGLPGDGPVDMLFIDGDHTY